MASLREDGGIVKSFFSTEALRVFEVEGGNHEWVPSRYVGNEHDSTAGRNNCDNWKFFAEVAVDVVEGWNGISGLVVSVASP